MDEFDASTYIHTYCDVAGVTATKCQDLSRDTYDNEFYKENLNAHS